MQKENRKKDKIIAIVFIIFLIGLFLTVFILNKISKDKGIITLNTSNIVEQLNNNRSLQYFKLEKGTYEVYDNFYTGYATESMGTVEYGTTSKTLEQNYFLVRVIDAESNGYYMVVRIATETDTRKPSEHNVNILKALKSGQTCDLTGMVSELNDNHDPDERVLQALYSILPSNTNNFLKFCMNVN